MLPAIGLRQECYWGGPDGVIGAAPAVPPSQVLLWAGRHAGEAENEAALNWAVDGLLRHIQ